MNHIFDAPPEGATPKQGHQKALKIEYKSGKIPADLADMVTPEKFPDRVQAGTLGFSYWEDDAKARRVMPELTFVVLDVYAGVDGYDKASGHSFWSNRVKNTKDESMAVFSSAQKGAPIATGLYTKGGFVGGVKLPSGASYTKFVRAYCVQLDKVVEIVLTTASERGMQKAVEAADHAAGRMKTKWESIFILSIADNDHLWGFHLTGYRRVNDKGLEYAGKGDLYIEPVFHAGIVNPVKQPQLFNLCREYQESERAAHEQYRARYADQQAAPVTATHTPQAAYNTPATNPALSAPFPAATDAPPVDDTGDLPF